MALQPGLFAALNRGTYAELYGTGLGALQGMMTAQSPQVTVGGAGVSVLS